MPSLEFLNSSPNHDQKSVAFHRINTDLQSALKDWEVLAAQAPKLAADEKRLKEMQELLSELQKKIKELGL